jgi:hypothetical protein
VKTAARRALIGGLLAGGTVLVAEPAEATGTAWCPQLLAVTALRAGDLIVGDAGTIQRVATVKQSRGGYQVHRTDPHTGASAPLRSTPYPVTQRFVVVLRKVPASAVTLTAAPTEPLVDGGNP